MIVVQFLSVSASVHLLAKCDAREVEHASDAAQGKRGLRLAFGQHVETIKADCSGFDLDASLLALRQVYVKKV